MSRLDPERLRDHGVVGAGGAGFPAYRKIEAAAEVVLMNAAECEPLLHKDKEILRRHRDEVLEAMTRVMERVGARRGIVAIKHKYHDLIEALRKEGAARGLEVLELGDFYPAGDEFVTVFEATGRVVPPGGLPLDVGCLVMNVETLLNVARDAPVTHKVLTVCGDVPEPVTVRVPLGMSYREVLAGVGAAPETVGTILVGGVMMGKPAASLDAVVTRTTGALVCLPEDHGLARRYLAPPSVKARIGRSACDQCSFCTELCPRYLLGHPVEPHLAMRSLGFHQVGEALVLGSQFCCECNLCSLYACPEDLFPKDACVDNKAFMRERSLQHPARGRTDVRPHSMQEYRHIPVSSLIKKLGLSGFRNVGPWTDVDWKPARVRIPLRQHVGAPAVAAVKPGERVKPGQRIGAAPEGLGVAVHASIAGRVASVGEDVVIEA